MSDELFSHRLRKFRDLTGYSQDDTGKLLGITGRYVGMIERGEKDVEPHTALAKLFALLETNKVHPSEFEPRGNGHSNTASVVHEEPSIYHAAPPRLPTTLNVEDVLSQIQTDLKTIQSGPHAEKRRALIFLRDVHLPCLAKILKLEL